MTIVEFVHYLEAKSVSLYLEAGELRYRGPRGSLADDDRAWIATNRRSLIEHVAQRSNPVPPGRCEFNYCKLSDWLDAPPSAGRIRTTCGKCGRFIGYRPAGVKEEDA